MHSLHDRHEPTRTCVGCAAKEPKGRLLRLVRDGSGIVTLDAEGTMPGRGAWVHGRTGCLARAEMPRALGRAFRGKAKAPAPGRLLEEAHAAGVRLEDDARDGGVG